MDRRFTGAGADAGATPPRAAPIALGDKYRLEEGRVFMSGLQALVRLPLVQARRDRAAGLNTAGFISGYRGSPLGGYDQELWRAKAQLDAENVVFQPGLNEELAATAVWGSQQVGLHPGARYDGVFGLWYGKGPGLDRAMDVLKHANAAGTSPHGGVLAVVGDDHGAKSSTLPHQSDHSFTAAFVPFLYPSGVGEFVEYGLLGWAMSRFAGCWVGFKATADTVETATVVDLAGEERQIVIPEFEFPEAGVHIRPNDVWREEDWRLQRYKGFAALAFARANAIDRMVWDTPRPRIGIVTAGKAYADVMEALDELGIDERLAAAIGLRLYKVGMPWPLEPEGIHRFAEGLEEVLVVEEKREFIEHQLKWQLFNWRQDVRPRVVGKHDEEGEWLLSPDNELTPGMIAHVIASRLQPYHDTPAIREKLAFFSERVSANERYVPPARRTPFFCSGCPHNTSTKVPEGSRGLGGIGCHIMALWMDRSTDSFSQMGGEGVSWVGEAPFTEERHVFANLGDGTYSHSGILAIRQAVAARVNITYKLLFNDAVAMTGGQPVEGGITVPRAAAQLMAEGVAAVAVLTEDLERYEGVELPEGVRLADRRELADLQKKFRETPGCTVIIYDQTCAAEKRRRRKRGQMPDPGTRVFINSAVCEACGDCSVQSNCISIEPLETEFGTKRRINQSSCNKDYSCLKGFCPSFVTLEGAALASAPEVPLDLTDVPEPVQVAGSADIFITGIGGTGVLTLSSLLGHAAHIEGKTAATADMAGLAQKGGGVYAHVRLAEAGAELISPRIIAGGADLVLACDAVTAADKVAQNLMSPGKTSVVANADMAPTSAFVLDRDAALDRRGVEQAIRAAARPDGVAFVAATTAAEALLGDALGANMLLLGYAWQKGLVPLAAESIEQAITLNGIAVDWNVRAFALGRLLAHDPAKVEAMLREARGPADEPASVTLDQLIERRMADLTDYQDERYARRYGRTVERVRRAEAELAPGSAALADAAARSLYKLMAYKDEYEVARLYTDGRFERELRRQFATTPRMKVHLAPPLLSKEDPATGRPRKRSFGPWILPLFKGLARMKRLRGTALDPFGHGRERRIERQLIKDYQATLDRLLAALRPDNVELAAEIARLPMDIRGFGPVKMAALEKARAREAELWARWPGEAARAAA